MSYRPPSTPPTTSWARHLDSVLRDRDWSRVRLFEEVGEALGYSPKSRSAFLPLLEDKDPTAKQAEILRGLFGDPPSTPTPSPEPPDLSTALLALASELGEARRERQAWAERAEAMERAMMVMAERLAALEGAASSARPVRRA